MVGKVAKVKRPVSPWSKRSSGLRKPAAATWIHPAEYCVEREERAVSPRPTATTPDPPSAVSSVETLADRAKSGFAATTSAKDPLARTQPWANSTTKSASRMVASLCVITTRKQASDLMKRRGAAEPIRDCSGGLVEEIGKLAQARLARDGNLHRARRIVAIRI